MKYLSIFIFFISLFTSSLTFANNAMPSQLVGQWLYSEPGKYNFPDLYTFHSDGSFTQNSLETMSKPKHRSVICVAERTVNFDSVVLNQDGSYTLEGKSKITKIFMPAPGTHLKECQDLMAMDQRFSPTFHLVIDKVSMSPDGERSFKIHGSNRTYREIFFEDRGMIGTL